MRSSSFSPALFVLGVAAVACGARRAPDADAGALSSDGSIDVGGLGSDASMDVGKGDASEAGTAPAGGAGGGGGSPPDGAGGSGTGGTAGASGTGGASGSSGRDGGSDVAPPDVTPPPCGVDASSDHATATGDSATATEEAGAGCNLVRSGDPIDLTALGWTNAPVSNSDLPKTDLSRTGDPTTVVRVGPELSCAGNGFQYVFLSPWDAWSPAAVIGPSSRTPSIGAVAPGIGNAFENLLYGALLQVIPAGAPPSSPLPTVGDIPPYGLQPQFLARLPQGFLLGVWSSYYQPDPPQQPLLAATFGRLIEVGDDGHVAINAGVLVGCNGPGHQYNFDALAVDGGQILAVQSVGPASSCPPGDQRVTGTPQIHVLLRTAGPTIDPVHIFDAPATSVHLFPSSDGAWLVLPNQSLGDISKVSTISFARLDKSGRPLTPLTQLSQPAMMGADFLAGASVGGNRLALAVRFATGSAIAYALELLDENGSVTAIIDMPRILGLVSSTTEDRLLVSQSGTALYDNTVQIVRYDHVCRSTDGPIGRQRAAAASTH